MFASRLSIGTACLALSAQTLAACALIEPVSPDAQLPEPDAGWAAAPGAEDEGEAESANDPLRTEPGARADAGAPAIAADAALAPDAAPITADAAREDAAEPGTRCEADWGCAPNEVCSRVSGQCAARCQGESCLGPTISDTNDRLVSDGARVCYADDSEAPGSGDFALRTWDGVAPRATTLTRARAVHALLLDAEYCYFHAAGALRRAALSGGCVELLQEMVEPPSRIWSHEAHVSWSTAAGELYRVAPGQNARAERVESSSVETLGGENTYATSAMVGERLIQRHAAEGRLQAAAVR